jgi:site-specific DNA-adenine methylase
MNQLTYEALTGKTTKELIELCKAQKIQRWSGKRKKDLIAMLCCGNTRVIEPRRLVAPVVETPGMIQDSEPLLKTPGRSDVIPEPVQISESTPEVSNISEPTPETLQMLKPTLKTSLVREPVRTPAPIREPVQEPVRESESVRLQRMIERWGQEKGAKLDTPKLSAVIGLDPVPFAHPNREIEEFLKTIRQRSAGYSRVNNSPLRYVGATGSKVGLILQHFPILTKKRVVSLFLGSGSLELVLAQNLGYEVIGYEPYEGFANVWQEILTRPNEFANRVRLFEPTRENYMNIRDQVLKLDNPHPEHVYFHLQLSYNAMVGGWPSSIYLNDRVYDQMTEKLRSFKAPTLQVQHATFEDVFQKHPDDFLFINPPEFTNTEFPHQQFRDLLRKHKGGFFLIYNDCYTIRDWYYGYDCIIPMWTYTLKHEDVVDKTETRSIFIVSKPK